MIMHNLIWFIAGFLFASALGFVVALYLLRQQRRKVIRAYRRAADAERLAELGRMTSGLAHEIRNPLSTIGLNAQLLAEDISDSQHLDAEEQDRLSRRIESLHREIERLRGILTDFLQYAGRIHLDAEPQDVNLIVDELADFITPKIQAAGIQLFTSPAKQPAIARVDSALLKQALLNLILNAIQAFDSSVKKDNKNTGKTASNAAHTQTTAPLNTPPPRQIMLRVVKPSGQGDDAGVIIHVTDTGPGIDTELQKEIFLPYYTTKAGGTGLGLPTARRIIEEHKGYIEVHSEIGRGTDFVLHLPVGTISSTN